MASYHFAVQIVRRSQGRSAIAMAAYRAGERLHDIKNGRVCDFSLRRGVEHSEILLPDGAAVFMGDREKLWNYVERMEARQDAQLAREINFALPHELDHSQRRELVSDFVREAFLSRGMVADVAIHSPVPEKGDDPRNYHAHVMLTMRQATRTGLRPVKTREWNSDGLLRQWRSQWAEHQNRALKRAGRGTRVDHRTLREQRMDAIARKDRVAAAVLDRDPEIHIGPEAAKLARRRPPISKDREAGPRRTLRRVVRYRRIDRGPRTAFNRMRVERNAVRLSRHVAKWKRHMVRVSWRLERLERVKGTGNVQRVTLLASLLKAIEALLRGLLVENTRLRERRQRFRWMSLPGRGRYRHRSNPT